MSEVTGGDKLQKYLEELAKNLSKGDELKVGFLEGSTYPDGTSVPMVAAVNEFGGSIDIPERTQDLEFNQNSRTGEVGRKFTKKGKGNFVQTVTIPAHTITIPPRPYFRNMLIEKAPGWGAEMGKILVSSGYDTKKALGLMGERIQGQLKESIIKLDSPPNAASTLRKKAGTNPLIDTGHMLNSVDYEVSE
ncbi:hypothetical protein [Yersinia sp. 2545 StPb PI]|uniref:hypothetical protein n=1 Tax=Yersinia sp. 2545 StPb PI TaxID=3117410 RepID=UPI003FA4C43A